MKRLFHEFFAGLNVVKDVFVKDEETAVNASADFTDVLDSFYDAGVVGIDQMKAGFRLDADEDGGFTRLPKDIDKIVDVEIGEPIRIICEKIFFPGEMFFSAFEAHTDV